VAEIDNAGAGGAPKPRYPFARTTCACRLCAISCEHLPGALAPSDLPILAAHLGYEDVGAYAREHLVASEGPTLRLEDGRVVSLPTLVPGADASGACRYYEGGRCAVHAVAPFGCSHVDAHMGEAEFERRTQAAYAELLGEHARSGVYARLTAELRASGRSAPPVELRRARLAEAMRREGL
jgi:hypothetical protein